MARRQHFLVVSIIILLVGIASVMVQMKLTTILPSLTQRFSMEQTEVSLLMSMFTFVGLVLALPVGFAAKRFGARAMLLAGVGFIALGGVVGTLAGGSTLLIISRAIEGIAYIIIITCGPLAIERYVAPERLGTAMGIWGTYGCGGTLVSGVVTPTLYELAGFAGLWLAYAAFAVFTGALFVFVVKDPRGVATRLAKKAGVATADRVADGAAAQAGDADAGSGAASADAGVGAGAGAGVGAGAGSVVAADGPASTDAAPSDSSSDPGYRVFFSLNMILFLAPYVLFNILIAVTLSFSPTYMQSQGLSSAESGLVISSLVAVALVSCIVFGMLVDRFGRCKPLYVIALLATGPAAYLLTSSVGVGMWVGAALLGLFGMSASAVCPTAFVRILNCPAMLGVGMGVLKLMQCLGQTIGNYGVPLLLGPAMDNWPLVAIASLVVGLLSAGCMLLCKYR